MYKHLLNDYDDDDDGQKYFSVILYELNNMSIVKSKRTKKKKSFILFEIVTTQYFSFTYSINGNILEYNGSTAIVHANECFTNFVLVILVPPILSLFLVISTHFRFGKAFMLRYVLHPIYIFYL